MIINFDSVDLGAIALPRTVIVGAGPVGLALAQGLRRRGIPVLVLEGGTDVSAQVSDHDRGDILGLPFTGMSGRGTGLGGGMSQWAGQCFRFHTGDFASRDWVEGSGWPISADEVLPYYAEAEQYFGISADGYHGSVWRDFGIEPGRLIESDVHLRFSVYTPQPDLFARDKKSLANDKDTVIVYNATVTGFHRDGERIRRLTVQSLAGSHCVVEADTVILCVGAIETARMLLQPSVDFPDGMGTASGHVGRHFQDHPGGAVARILPLPGSRSASEPAVTTPGTVPELFSLFYRSGRRYLPRMVMSPRSQQSLNTLNGCALPVFEWGEGSMTESLRQVQGAVLGRRFDLSARSSLARVLKNPAQFGTALKRRAQGRSVAEPPAATKLHVFVEQDPQTSSRVVLGSRRDRFGSMLPAVDWALGDRERHTAINLAVSVGAYFTRHGLGRVELDPALESEGWRTLFHDNQHHAGTARMAVSPKDGVVDTDGRIFGLANSYIAGGAVFPTSSYANPTLTMVAMAFRMASHLAGDARLRT